MNVKLSRLYADVAILPLLKRKIVLNRLLLESPEIGGWPHTGLLCRVEKL
jgi:uncharacterized protein involved in outer membrane biogenesis